MTDIENSFDSAELPVDDGVEIFPTKVLPCGRIIFLFFLSLAAVVLFVVVYPFFGFQPAPTVNRNELISRANEVFDKYGCQSFLNIVEGTQKETKVESWGFKPNSFLEFFFYQNETDPESWAKRNHYYYGQHFSILRPLPRRWWRPEGEKEEENGTCSNLLAFGGEENEILTFIIDFKFERWDGFFEDYYDRSWLSMNYTPFWDRQASNGYEDVKDLFDPSPMDKLRSFLLQEFGTDVENEIEVVDGLDWKYRPYMGSRFVFSVSKSQILKDEFLPGRENEINRFMSLSDSRLSFFLQIAIYFLSFTAVTYALLIPLLIFDTRCTNKVLSPLLLLEGHCEYEEEGKRKCRHSSTAIHLSYFKSISSPREMNILRVVSVVICVLFIFWLVFQFVVLYYIYRHEMKFLADLYVEWYKFNQSITERYVRGADGDTIIRVMVLLLLMGVSILVSCCNIVFFLYVTVVYFLLGRQFSRSGRLSPYSCFSCLYLVNLGTRKRLEDPEEKSKSSTEKPHIPTKTWDCYLFPSVLSSMCTSY